MQVALAIMECRLYNCINYTWVIIVPFPVQVMESNIDFLENLIFKIYKIQKLLHIHDELYIQEIFLLKEKMAARCFNLSIFLYDARFCVYWVCLYYIYKMYKYVIRRYLVHLMEQPSWLRWPSC